MKPHLLAIAFALSALVAPIAAQDPAPYRPGPPSQSPSIYYHHASTYEEGVQRGAADLARAVGEYNYNTSLAMINREEAIRRRIANQAHHTQTYFEMRRINDAYRAAQRPPAPTKQTLMRCNESRLPSLLTAREYDTTLKKLIWPLVLQSTAFARERGAIDQIMAARTPEDSGLGSSSYDRIRELVGAAETRLQSLTDSMSSAERIAARKFLASVLYEARLPVTVDAARLAAK